MSRKSQQRINVVHSDKESSAKVPVILHVDPIWPPHMRKKRASRSFRDIVKRKTALLKFLGDSSPSKTFENVDFKNADTLLTVMERVKRHEERQRNILERIQNQAINDLKKERVWIDVKKHPKTTTSSAQNGFNSMATQWNSQMFEVNNKSKMRIKTRRQDVILKKKITTMYSELSMSEIVERSPSVNVVNEENLIPCAETFLKIDEVESKVLPCKDKHLHCRKTISKENKLSSFPRKGNEMVYIASKRTSKGTKLRQLEERYCTSKDDASVPKRGQGGRKQQQVERQPRGEYLEKIMKTEDAILQLPVKVNGLHTQASDESKSSVNKNVKNTKEIEEKPLARLRNLGVNTKARPVRDLDRRKPSFQSSSNLSRARPAMDPRFTSLVSTLIPRHYS
jgi:hypothetical protein